MMRDPDGIALNSLEELGVGCTRNPSRRHQRRGKFLMALTVQGRIQYIPLFALCR